jgi:uncharacterized protein YjiS (DUF1127 family)
MTGIESSVVEAPAQTGASPPGTQLDPTKQATKADGTKADATKADAAPTPKRRGPVVRLWRRLWGSDVAAQARAALKEPSERQLGDLRRAFAVRELAESALLSASRTEVMATTLPALVEMAR